MLGKLNNDQIANILSSQTIGRIGCMEDGKMYIIPISYAFDNGSIYSHSMEGLKIKIMRNNPSVCFQVDSIETMTNWRSVIIWGEFEEIKNEEDYEAAKRILNNRLDPFVTSDAVHPHHENEINQNYYVEKGKKILLFKIRISEQSGRFEKNSP